MLHGIVHIGLFASAKNRYLFSHASQIFEGYFHSMLCTLKSKFHGQSESLKGGFEVPVHEYTQNEGLLGALNSIR